MTVSALLIAGPTASGKSGLAINLARLLSGAIINADSMQVYRGIPVLSARPNVEQTKLAPHYLFGHVDAAVNYSAGLWLADMAQTLTHVRKHGLLPIITGGTGLYFKALTQGLSEIPAVHERVRADVRAWGEGKTPQALHDRLAASDPIMAARLRPSDPQRILRALEVLEATGQSLAHFQGARSPALIPDAVGIFLSPERKALFATIDARFDAMLAQGAAAEVRALLARGLDPALPAMRALGVPTLAASLRGEISWELAVEQSKAASRAYAKRQFTFARHQLPLLQWVEPASAQSLALKLVGAPQA